MNKKKSDITEHRLSPENVFSYKFACLDDERFKKLSMTWEEALLQKMFWGHIEGLDGSWIKESDTLVDDSTAMHRLDDLLAAKSASYDLIFRRVIRISLGLLRRNLCRTGHRVPIETATNSNNTADS